MLTLEHREKRQKYICGSDVARIMGHSKFGTAADVWREKKEKILPETNTNPDIARGSRFEREAAYQYTIYTKWRTKIPREMIVSNFYPWLAASLDRWTRKNYSPIHTWIPLELKCPRQNTMYSWEMDGVPAEYIIQCITQMLVTDTRQCRFFGLNLETMKPYLADIDYNERIADAILVKTKMFWDALQQHEEPPQELLQSLNQIIDIEPVNAAEVIDAEEIAEKIERYQKLKSEAQQLESQYKEIEQEIRLYYGESKAKYLSTDKYIVSRSNPIRKRSIDIQRLSADSPEMYDKYSYWSQPYRTIHIKERKHVN